jgi:hypothetical protein
MLDLKLVNSLLEDEMNSRSPLQQFGDMVGLYAYLAATGGLRYWPLVRRELIEEQSLRQKPASKPKAEHERDRVAGY